MSTEADPAIAAPMSLATRCPACSTTFKVVPDQLRISEGWVRCGRCSLVFDGSDNMVDPAQPVSAVSAAVRSPEPDVETFDAPDDDDLPWTPAATDVSPAWQGLPSLDLGGVQKIEPAGSAEDRKAPAAVVQDEPASEDQPALQDQPVPQEEPEPFIVRQASEAQTLAREDRSDVLPGAADFSFLGAPVDPVAQRRRVVRRRIALGTLAVLALLVLVGQILHQSRDLLVARQPALRPAFTAWCRLAGCTLSSLRKIDDIAIEGSAFVRQQADDGYLLSFTLRNRSTLPLAMPALELSLLDTQERPVLRRVLRPVDFDAPTVLSARGEHAAALPLALAPAQAAALQPLIVGYHLDAFYP